MNLLYIPAMMALITICFTAWVLKPWKTNEEWFDASNSRS